MNSDQLEQFKIIAESGSLTRAAETLYISQPALSKTLKNLEAELGCKLFYRGRQKLNITKEGKRLLEYANAIITTMNNARQEFISYDKKKRFKIYSPGYYLPSLLNEYYEENIDHLDLHIEPDDVIPAMLMNKHADAVIADDYYLRHYTTRDIDRTPLFKEQLILTVPGEHRWFFRDRIPLKEIQGEPLLYIDMQADADYWIQEVLKLNKCNLNVKMKLDETLFRQMRGDLHYPYLSSSTTSIIADNIAYLKDRKMIRVNALYSNRYVYLWYYKNSYKPWMNVIEIIKKNAAKYASQIEML